ncbi:MAG: hypothetical protein Q9214_002265, partial [Letrouitia sp. 1 TL-2023]
SPASSPLDKSKRKQTFQTHFILSHLRSLPTMSNQPESSSSAGGPNPAGQRRLPEGFQEGAIPNFPRAYEKRYVSISDPKEALVYISGVVEGGKMRRTLNWGPLSEEVAQIGEGFEVDITHAHLFAAVKAVEKNWDTQGFKSLVIASDDRLFLKNAALLETLMKKDYKVKNKDTDKWEDILYRDTWMRLGKRVHDLRGSVKVQFVGVLETDNLAKKKAEEIGVAL